MAGGLRDDGEDTQVVVGLLLVVVVLIGVRSMVFGAERRAPLPAPVLDEHTDGDARDGGVCRRMFLGRAGGVSTAEGCAGYDGGVLGRDGGIRRLIARYRLSRRAMLRR